MNNRMKSDAERMLSSLGNIRHQIVGEINNHLYYALRLNYPYTGKTVIEEVALLLPPDTKPDALPPVIEAPEVPEKKRQCSMNIIHFCEHNLKFQSVLTHHHQIESSGLIET